MKKTKIIITTLCLVVLLGFSISAYAESKTRSFTYDFKHQLGVKGSYKANLTSAKFYITTKSNEGKDTYFHIKQFKCTAWGNNTYQRKARISCVANKTDWCYLSTEKGKKYKYEFWKPTAVGYVKGYGSISY